MQVPQHEQNTGCHLKFSAEDIRLLKFVSHEHDKKINVHKLDAFFQKLCILAERFHDSRNVELVCQILDSKLLSFSIFPLSNFCSASLINNNVFLSHTKLLLRCLYFFYPLTLNFESITVDN